MSDSYESLCARTTIRGLGPSQALTAVSTLVDQSYTHRNPEGMQKAIKWCRQLQSPKWRNRLTPKQRGELWYYESVAWSDLETFNRRGRPEEWDWHQEEITQSVVCLRSSLRRDLFEAQDPIRRCQILTNLGNTLNRIGRTVEAIDHWTRALSINAKFAMALGNRGMGLETYASLLYDPGHRVLLLRQARDDLAAAIALDLDEEPRRAFRARLDDISSILKRVDSGVTAKWDGHSLGRSQRERDYRKWCLGERLFLNPLNDISARTMVAHDVLGLPSIVVSSASSEMPRYIGVFNSLKQEYASARFLFYEGTSHERAHYSDRGVMLMNTLDYPSYGLGREQVKCAYRMSYSILDKTGLLLNEYFGLGIPPKAVSFREMWFEEQKKSLGLLKAIQGRPNLPMRGLYWVSRDLFDDKDGFKDCTEPDAQELQQIRNSIEHRHLKVHERLWTGPDDPSEDADRLSVAIYRDELEAKALRMLKFARTVLVYVTCCVQVEERARSQQRGSGVIMPMQVDRWDDDWKV